MGGAVAELDFRSLLGKRQTVQGITILFEIWYHIFGVCLIFGSLTRMISLFFSSFSLLNVIVREPHDSGANEYGLSSITIVYNHMVIVSHFLTAAGLRSRSLENKAVIVREVEEKVWPAIVAGKVKPVVYKSFPLSEAGEAHRLMESSNHIGKILLVP